jgi:dienelactone hydrolase
MKRNIYSKCVLILSIMLGINVNGRSGTMPPDIKEEVVTYTANGVTLKGFVAFDNNIKGKRPAVIVVHEWWGLNDYARMRARKLAELGYIAMAADMFGNGTIAANPTEAQALTGPYYSNPDLARTRLDAALRKIKEYSQTD